MHRPALFLVADSARKMRRTARKIVLGVLYWTAKDPIGFGGQQSNLYAYVGDDPINRTDPDGKNPLVTLGVRATEGLLAAAALFGNYLDMREANTQLSDKYFHCKAHCQATQFGAGGQTASRFLGEARERFDENIKGDSPAECNLDRAANATGRLGQSSVCEAVCQQYRPSGLSPDY